MRFSKYQELNLNQKLNPKRRKLIQIFKKLKTGPEQYQGLGDARIMDKVLKMRRQYLLL